MAKRRRRRRRQRQQHDDGDDDCSAPPMNPQNGQMVQGAFPPATLSVPFTSGDGKQLNMDSSMAKQMHLLNAAGLSRQQQQQRQTVSSPLSAGPANGTSSAGSFFGGMPATLNQVHLQQYLQPQQQQQQQHQQQQQQPQEGATGFPFQFDAHGAPAQNLTAPNMQAPSPATPDPSTMRQMPNLQQRQRGFFISFTNTMNARGTPLPPALTGVPYPSGYDPNTSPWKNLEISPNGPGVIRIAGKDVELFRLWGSVLQLGGSAKVTAQNLWPNVAKHFDLPEHINTPSGIVSGAMLLQHHYHQLLTPVEDAYRRNAQHQQQQRAMSAAGGQQMMPGSQQQPQLQQGPQPQMPPRSNSLGASNNHPMSSPHGAPMNGMMPPGSPQTVMPMFNGVNGGMPSNMSPGGAGMVPGRMGTPGVAGGVVATGPMTVFSGTPVLGANSIPSGNSNAISTAAATPERAPSSMSNHHGPSSAGMQPGANMMPSMGAVPGIAGEIPHGMGDVNVLNGEPGMKRKSEEDNSAEKRARPKIESDLSSLPSATSRGSQPPSSATPGASTSTMGGTTEQGPTRKKIEYVPLARDVETYGGRDVQIVIDEHARHRSTRGIDEWGMVDVDCLTLSLRSRLPTELAYALETVTVLSTMRSQTPTSGFPIFNCPELMDELLDLIEDCAFDGAEDNVDPAELYEARIWTHREMVEHIHVDEGGLFAALKTRQGQKDESLGPKQHPGNYVLAVMTILRNFTTVHDNLPFLFAHPRLVDVALRVCDLDSSGSSDAPQPRAKRLGLSHIITLRKDMLVLLTAATLEHNVRFSSGTNPTTADLRRGARIYNLAASFLVHEREALSPFGLVRLQEQHGKTPLRPPTTADLALDVFTHVFQPDVHRQVLARAVSHVAMWCVFRGLTHRLPVSTPDFQVVKNGDLWPAYLEKLVMALYVLAFLAPPEVKIRMKQDRTLRFPQVVMRMVHRFLLAGGSGAEIFLWPARRAIEVMRLIDEGRDCFDVGGSGPTTGPTLSFGVGYGEVDEQSEDVGDGLLGGYREMAWEMMMHKDIDDVTFMELDRLARVQH